MEKSLRFLIDTKVWIESLLHQRNYQSCNRFFKSLRSELFSISDFSLHSLAIILIRYKKAPLFKDFVRDVFENGDTQLVSLDPIPQINAMALVEAGKYDFDDAYQLCLAEKRKLTLVTLDCDFRKWKAPHVSPDEAIELYKQKL